MAQQAAAANSAAVGGAAPRWSEDWLAVAAGLVVFLLAMAQLLGGNLLGWATSPRVWLEIGKAVRPGSQAYVNVEPVFLLLATYAFSLVLLTIGAALLRVDILRFVASFTIVFWLAYCCW